MPSFKDVLRLWIVVLISNASFAQPIQLVNAFPNLTFTQPVLVTHANDGTNRIFVVQQNGLIRVFPNDSTVTSAGTFLNISSRISTGGERGLLGLAFHPNYASNGYFFVNYTQTGTGRTIVSRFRVDPNNPDQADPNSEFILLNIYQPYSNHNGGMILFGSDGYLYVGMGDGGSAGDPGNRAQNLDSLLGKLLRINVDTITATTNYGIPPDNPFVGIGGRDEIYAWGLRNPWRFSQDPLTGEIWLADVGQGSWEEVDLIGSGLNYGWRCYEGPNPYNTSGCGPPSQYTFPVKYYARLSPHCSVTGGYIYRGSRRPDLIGRYIYGDYCSGYIWKFYYQSGQLREDTLLIDAPFAISSFGVDQDGELYICNYAASGSIWRFVGNPVYLSTTQVSPVNGSRNVAVPTELRWRSAAGALNYWLDVSTDQNFSTIVVRDTTLTDTAVTVSNLGNGIRYYWRLRAKNAAGWGNYSSVWRFTTMAVPGQIYLVEPLDQANVLPPTASMRWRTDHSATVYWVEIGHDSTFAVVSHRDTAVTDTTYTIGDALADTIYYWRVRGRNSAGDGPFSSVWKFTTFNLPSAPVLVYPPDSSVQRPDTLQFLWNALAGIDHYWFEVSDNESFSSVIERDSAVVDTAKVVYNLPQLQLLYWRVRAKNRAGYGSFSITGRFFTNEILAVDNTEVIPTKFALHQNYPNPFNPMTRISYDLPQESHVTISVSNLLGQGVSILYRGIQRAGTHSLEFDASGLPSGVYFYRMETEKFHSVRKMVFMR